MSAAGYGWLGALAVVSTVGAVGLFFAGLRRVGPTAASILSTLEPVVAVGLAFAVFGESLGLTQLAGGALVVSVGLLVAFHSNDRPPAPPGKDADPKEYPWYFEWSRGEAGDEPLGEAVPPGGDRRPSISGETSREGPLGCVQCRVL